MAAPGRQRLLTWGGASLFALACAALLHQLSFVDTIERKSYDWRCANLRQETPPAGSNLVLVDEATLAFFKKTDGIRWPFPRDVYCPVLAYLKAGGAKAVAFDVQFSEPDEFDGPFAECIADAGNVVLGMQCRADKAPAALPLPGTVAVAGPVQPPRCTPLPPMPALAKAARAVGAIDMEPDPDGVLRHVTPIRSYGGGALGSLGVAAHLVAEDVRSVRSESDQLIAGALPAPVNADGRMLVRWRAGDAPYPAYSFKQIYANAMLHMDGEKTPLPPSTFKGRTVFIATSAAGTYEVRVTPMREADYGVHLHAATYEALRSGDHSRDVPPLAELLLLIVFTVAVAAAMTLLDGALKQSLGVASLVAIHLGIVGYCFERYGLWLETVVPSLAMLAAWGYGGVANYLTEGRAKRELRTAFQHYLAPEVVKQLVSDPSKLQLGGERRDITAFFSDIAGFTTFSEAMEPAELVAFLNEYLTELTVIITEEGGTIDKYEGDAIIAMFGAPIAHDDHAVRACRAALRCQARLDEKEREWQARGLPRVHTRIGLNSGAAVVGNMGASFRFDYTMIGDTVNLAARLEGTNKVYGTRLLVGAGTFERAYPHIAMREIDLVQVKGKTIGIAVYEPESMQGDAAYLAASPDHQRRRAAYAAALSAYRSGDFATAADAWDALAAEGDPASATMASRARQLAASPPETWDGVYAMTSK